MTRYFNFLTTCTQCDENTYVDDDSLTEVMVMRHWVEVVLARVLRVLVDTLLFVTGDLRQ